MAHRKVDMSLLSELVKGASEQTVVSGISRSSDPNFPVFSTPNNKDIIVYIPRTNMIVDEKGETMGLLKPYIHNVQKGKQFGALRCMSDLTGPAYEKLGFDGTCPACEAMQDVWELYNRKLKHEADKLHIDMSDESLKTVRNTLLGEMDIKPSDQYVIFPIVIIPTSGPFQPTETAMKDMKAMFVQMRLKRYEEKILASLNKLVKNPGHPAGLFWVWAFSYNHGDKQPTSKLSALNATYTVITEQSAIDILNPFRETTEKVASGFTLDKASEVVKSIEFLYKEDYEAEVDSYMLKTRMMLKAGESVSTANVALGNPLQNFGVEAPSADASNTKQPDGIVRFA